MKCNIRGDKILVTKAIKEYVIEKISKLEKYFDKANEITANILCELRHPQNRARRVCCRAPCFLRRICHRRYKTFSA